MARTLINIPAKAKKGEILTVKTLISHEMETGYRIDNVGKNIPRDIIKEFVCTYNGQEVFRAELFQAIAANPFFSFPVLATESGTIAFKWTGDNGFSQAEAREIVVE